MDHEKEDALQNENTEFHGEEAGKVDHVWHEDESTMWQRQEPQDMEAFRAEETANEKSAYQSAYEDPFDVPPQGVAPKPQRPKKPHKPFPWKKFWKISAASVMGLMLLFSSVTSVVLLKDHIASKHTINQSVPQVTASSSDNVNQAASSGDELSVAEINNKVSPSVVLISGSSMSGSGQGTGVIISDDGYIATNAHVVSDFSDLKVTLNNDDKTEYPATIVGTDTTTDLAVIRINATGLTPAEFGTSSTLQVGQNVVAIGNPLGEEFSGSVSNGIISALDRDVQMGDGQVYTYIQTTAAINSGNSGGPLLNMQGQVIGITSAKIDSSVAESMGFAIPIDTAVPVFNDLMKYGYVTNRPYIGLSGESLDEQYSSFYKLPQGVHITSIAQGSPAADTELQVDDIITAINGTEISTVGELNKVKNELSPGDTVELTVYRYSTGKSFKVELVLGEMVPSGQ